MPYLEIAALSISFLSLVLAGCGFLTAKNVRLRNWRVEITADRATIEAILASDAERLALLRMNWNEYVFNTNGNHAGANDRLENYGSRIGELRTRLDGLAGDTAKLSDAELEERIVAVKALRVDAERFRADLVRDESGVEKKTDQYRQDVRERRRPGIKNPSR